MKANDEFTSGLHLTMQVRALPEFRDIGGVRRQVVEVVITNHGAATRGNMEFQMLGGTYARDVEVPTGESVHPFLIPPLMDDTEVLIQFIEDETGEWFYSDAMVLRP
ncbi:MAG: hypothetical protein NZT92_22505 [Abditibacteriales bacterium]|nr:hypothetical protein [Abditibacteriales bacterium]MDW8368434.1 hypothetical protein [Abditibacteriales bacterium]